MKSSETNNVVPIGRHDIEALVRATDERPEAQPEPAGTRERGSKLGMALGVGGAALVALGFFPRGEAPAPAPQPETFADKVEESAQHPYDPATDEVVIDGIRIKPGNPDKNTASEAVLGNAEVNDYMAANPDEVASLTTSSMSLPSAESYAIVERDVDADGDTDAVAVPVK